MAEEHTNEGKADRQTYLEITQGGHRCIPMRKTKDRQDGKTEEDWDRQVWRCKMEI